MEKEQGSKKKDKQINLKDNLRLIYSYYCKLNNSKLKHKHFDDFNEKKVVMDLHQFMTFCKNFQILAKYKKVIENKSSNKLNTSNHTNNSSLGQKEHQSKIEVEQKTLLIHQSISKQSSASSINQKNSYPIPQIIDYGEQDDQPLIAPVTKMEDYQPIAYLKQRKLAELFKKYVDSSNQINFQSFLTIINILANIMFNNKSQTKKEQVQTFIKQEENEKFQKSNQNSVSFAKIMKYFKLDNKQSWLQTFQEINELHGNLDHLALMRSPIKKINLKNDPLKKVNNKNQESRYKANEANTMKDKSNNKLPQLSKSTNIKHSNKIFQYSQQKLNHSNLQQFLKQNKQKIELINKCYAQNTPAVTFEEAISKIKSKSKIQPTIVDPKHQNSTLTNESRTKKYSERHKDRVAGDLLKKSIGNLFDVSNLYDDEIFNKYIELNYSSDKGSKSQVMKVSRLI